jgi:hypothetical protein
VIYISCSAEDSLTAGTLKSFLAAVLDIAPDKISLACLHDEKLAGGGEISERLREAIGSCGVFFAMVTPASMTSDWVLFELGAAWALGKKIILLFLDGADFRDLPEPLAGFKHLDIGEQSAPLQMMGICREAASFLNLGLKRGSGVPAALERMISEMRRESAGEADEPSAAPEREEIGFPDEDAPGGGKMCGPEKWCAADYCEITCEAHSALKKETIIVNVLWDDLFKAIAPNIRQQRDEPFLESLVLNLCRERDADLRNGLAYGILKNLGINTVCFAMILSRLTAIGYIGTSRPPNSIFQRDTRYTFWKITQLGEDYLRELIAERRKIGV